MNVKRICSLFFWILLFLAKSAFAQIENTRADSAINAFNDVFLMTVEGETVYKKFMDSAEPDYSWTLALNIQGMQDAYERTGSTAHRAIVEDLVNSFLVLNPPPYDWNGWNDDLAWMALVMVRGFEMVGNEQLLTAAESTFREAYDRGWNTDFTEGGIWEQQPNYSNEYSSKIKEALSNNPMGHVACMLYQNTGDQYYLDRAIEIYEWSVSHIFNPKNGHVYAGVYRNGYLNRGLTPYNQGAFIDFSALLYDITGDERMLRNAVLAADLTISEMTTDEGIISNSSNVYNTWAAELARGLGHLAESNPVLWNKYYTFLKKNSDAAWANRRMDLHLTWNGWAQPSPEIEDEMANRYVSAVALHQHTPVTQYLSDTIQAEDYNFWKGITSVSNDAGGESIKLSNSGDWVEYLVEIPSEGTYTINMEVAATSDASLELLANNIILTTVDVPATGSFQVYTSVKTVVKLQEGFHAIRFKSVSGDLNIDHWNTESCDLIEPMVSVNGTAATAITEVPLNAGDNLTLSPLPVGGTWSWTGPDGFVASTREVSITDISESNGGTYTTQYKNVEGCISTKVFRVSLSNCTPTSVTTTVSVYNEGWQETTDVIDAGSFVKITGAPEGNWSWVGPNGFIANTSEITFNNIGYQESGVYTATYFDNRGCKNTSEITLELKGEDPCSTPIVPYINIDDWREGTFGSVRAEASFQLGPQASEGSWSWTGPGGFSSDQREIKVSDFDETKDGNYTATFTNAEGCVSTKEFIIGLEGCSTEPIVPEVLVDGQSWDFPDSVAVPSGGRFTITPPDLSGQWTWSGDNSGGKPWEGPYGYSSNKRVLSFDNVLDIHEGTYILTHVNENACIRSYEVEIFVEGDDYCATEITPYINPNNLGWEQSSTATLDEGQSFTVGPHPLDRYSWSWEGPNGFTSEDREFTISNVQSTQAGVYRATCINNIGCSSFVDYTINVNDEIDNPVILGVEAEVKWSLYPNPASDVVKIVGTQANVVVRVIDMNGRVLAPTARSNANGTAVIDVGKLKSGLYFIKIGAKEVRTLKLIKQ